MLRTNPQTESAVISNSSFFNRQKEAVSFSINSDSSIQAATSSIQAATPEARRIATVKAPTTTRQEAATGRR